MFVLCSKIKINICLVVTKCEVHDEIMQVRKKFSGIIKGHTWELNSYEAVQAA